MMLTIWGNLGADPELRLTTNGTRVLNIRVACSSWDQEARAKTTTWVRVAMFGSRAEKLSEILSKGSTVVCWGDLKMREYQGKSYLELKASNIEAIGPRRERPSSASGWAAPPDAMEDEDIPF